MPFGQKGVDGRSTWRASKRETELDWMDGVKVALGNSEMTVEAARQYMND